MFLIVLLNKDTFSLTSLFAKRLVKGNSLIAFLIFFQCLHFDYVKSAFHIEVGNKF